MAMKNRRFRDRARCRFCREKVKKMDYKDLQSLQKLTTGQGKLFSRKRSGNCATAAIPMRTKTPSGRRWSTWVGPVS